MPENLISCSSNTSKVYVHSGITSTVTDSFSSPGGSPSGLSMDGAGNLVFKAFDNATIFVMSGISGTVQTSFSAVGDNSGRGVGLSLTTSGNLLRNQQSGDTLSGVVYTHSGITATISSSFSHSIPGTNDIAIDFSGNLLLADHDGGVIYKMSGLSATQSASFNAAEITGPVGLTLDASGNLISSDVGSATIYIYSGVSSTVSSSFASPAASPRGLTTDALMGC